MRHRGLQLEFHADPCGRQFLFFGAARSKCVKDLTKHL